MPMKRDAASMGFHEGWGIALDQLVAYAQRGNTGLEIP